MNLMNVNEKSIGITRLSETVIQMKQNLNEVAKHEKALEDTKVVISRDQEYNSFDEMEDIINSEIQSYNKVKRTFNALKWVLILFETVNGYFAIVFLLQAVLDISFLIDWVEKLIPLMLAAIFSYALITFSVSSIKTNGNEKTPIMNYVIAFGVILALPLFNISIMLESPDSVNNTHIYVLSLIFTVLVGSLLILKSKEIPRIEEKRIDNLKKLKVRLEARRKAYARAEKKHLMLSKKNFAFENPLEILKEKEFDNPIFADLKKYLESYNDFAKWSLEYLESVKKLLRG